MATTLTRQLVARLHHVGNVLHRFADAEAQWEEPVRQLGDGSRVHTVWVAWSSRDVRRLSPGDLLNVREAFTLLYLLSHTDKQAWLDQVERFWHLSDTRSPLHSPHPCALAIKLEVTEPETIATLAMSALSSDYVSPALRALCEEVDAWAQQYGRRPSRCGIRVDLTIDSERKTQEYVTQIFLGLAQLLASMRVMHEQPLLLGDHEANRVVQKFEIQKLRIRHVGLPIDSLQFLKIVVHNGLHVSHFSGIFANRSTGTTVRVVDALQWLIPSTLYKKQVMQPTSSVKSVIIDSSWPSPFVPAIFSALQYSQSVHSLEFGTFRHDMDIDIKAWRNKLRWFAFAVLGHHARHNIRKLKLESYELEEADIDIIKEVLDDPASVPLATDALCVPSVFITASRFHLTKPHELRETRNRESRSTRITVYNASFPTGTRVCTHYTSEKIYSVLLPGYGVAWVHEDDVQELQDEDISPNPICSLDELIIPQLHASSMNAVASFIELIGQRLKSVRVDHTTEQCFASEWCQRVLASCPQLDRLCLRGVDVERLDVFAELALSRGIKLRALECTTYGSDMDAFVQALCDPTHPLSANLRELSLRIHLYGSDSEDEDLVSINRDFLQPYASMLDQNRILYDITLEFACVDCRTSVRQLVADVLGRFTTQAVAIRADRTLDIARRVGFLSAVDKAPESTAIHFLDTNVMTRIFQFATDERQRRVHISTMNV